MPQQAVLQAQGNLLFRTCGLFGDIPRVPKEGILVCPLLWGGECSFLPSFPGWDNRMFSGVDLPPTQGNREVSSP